MEAGQVVRVALPQSDGEHKPRPAVLIKSFPPYGDWLMLGISSSLDLAVTDLDVIIDKDHPSYALTRLNYPGVVRLGHAHVLPVSQIEGVIGKVDAETLELIKEKLSQFILSS